MPPQCFNALSCLLEHQGMFLRFVKVVFESLSCPHYERLDLKIILSVGKNHHKNIKMNELKSISNLFLIKI